MKKFKDLDERVQKLMLFEQVIQGSKRDESVFIEQVSAGLARDGGFDWEDSLVGHDNWRDVIMNEYDPSDLIASYQEVASDEYPELKEILKLKDASSSTSLSNIIEGVKDLVLHKDKQYGNSANNPLNIFGDKCTYGYRLDEKLSRVKNSESLRKDDVVDLIGGLLLVCQQFGWSDFSEFK